VVIAVFIKIGEELRQFDKLYSGELSSRQSSVRVCIETRETDGLLREHMSRECKRRHDQETTQGYCVHSLPHFLLVVWAVTEQRRPRGQQKRQSVHALPKTPNPNCAPNSAGALSQFRGGIVLKSDCWRLSAS
jgi:hypothetical protein